MKEKKEKELKEGQGEKISNDATKKFCLILAIGVIVCLLIIFVGVVVLKNVRDDANNVLNNVGKGNSNKIEQNYVVLEDGTKENVNKDIQNAEFTVDGRKFYNFEITEKDGLSTVKATLENVTATKLPGGSFKIRLYDSKDEIIKEYMVMTAEIEPNQPTTTVTSIVEDCSDASRVEVELVGVTPTEEVKSGE